MVPVAVYLFSSSAHSTHRNLSHTPAFHLHANHHYPAVALLPSPQTPSTNLCSYPHHTKSPAKPQLTPTPANTPHTASPNPPQTTNMRADAFDSDRARQYLAPNPPKTTTHYKNFNATDRKNHQPAPLYHTSYPAPSQSLCLTNCHARKERSSPNTYSATDCAFLTNPAPLCCQK